MITSVVAVALVPLSLAAVLIVLILLGRVAGSLFGHEIPAGAEATLANPAFVAICYVVLVVTTVVVAVRLRRRRMRDQEPRPVETELSRETDEAAARRGVPPWALVTAEIVAYVIVAALIMWPVAAHMSDAFLGYRDARYYMWLGWRFAELIRSGDIFSLRIPDVVYPVGVDIRLLDGQLPAFVGGLWNLVVGPYTAYNLGLMTGTLLSMWAARRVARRFSDSRIVWFLAAVAFATAPAIGLRMQVHFTMYYAFAVMLLLDEAVRVVKGEKPNPIRIGIWLFLCYLCSVYYLIPGAIAFTVIVVVGLYQGGKLRPALPRLAAGFGVGLLLLVPFLLPRVAYDREETAAGGDPVLLQDSYRASGDAYSIVTQPHPTTEAVDLPFSEELRRNFRNNYVHEATVFPGFILLLGGISAMLLLRSRWRLPTLVAGITMWVFSLGTSLKIDGRFLFTHAGDAPFPWLPYTLFFFAPGLGSLRSANRNSFTIAGILTIGLALALGWLWVRFGRGWQRGLIAAVALGVLATNLLIPVPRARLVVSTATRGALGEIAARMEDGDSLVHVPADCTGETLHNVNLQILHHAPVVGCQVSPSAIPWNSGLGIYETSEPFASLRCVQRFVGRLKTPYRGEAELTTDGLNELRSELGVRFFLIDKEQIALRRCRSVQDTAGFLRGEADVLAEDDRWIVLDVDAS